MNVPIFLTFLRIAAIPLLVVILLSNINGRELISFGVFFAATLTDMLDGFWARRKRQETTFGQLLDPTADKLLVASALICLVGMRAVPAWMVVIIIGRELAVSGFRAIASSRGIHIAASVLGKIKMILETFTIYFLLLGEKILGPFYVLSRIGLWLVILMALASAGEYSWRFGRAVLSNRS
ncbi:MAG: CDP-diacylglycerol--glycerol-3-phosphate 3-phosphatidyltransferase [Candidatus Aminicenantales bacterium]